MRYIDHKEKWADCERCPLHRTRRRIALARGNIPCEVLFIGEGPGLSEDSIGKPFIGPSGKLLDKWIAAAIQDLDDEPSILMTNLIACVPLGKDKTKTKAPPEWAVKKCSPRLKEIYEMAKPSLVVMVGDKAEKYAPKILDLKEEDYIKIMHPGRVIRMSQPQFGLACQKSVIAIRDGFAEHC